MSSAAKVFIIVGILSVSQLASGQQWSGGGGRRDENRPLSNDEIAQRMARTADFLKGLDANGNGMIDPDEADDPQAKNMLDRIFGRMGKEPHYPVAISEILQGYEAYYRARSNTSGGGSSSPGGTPTPGMGLGALATASSGGSSYNSSGNPGVSSIPGTGGAALTVTSSAAATAPFQTSAASPAPAPRKPARFLTARERLPKGLPDWFLEKANSDGQVTMAEFTDDWTLEKVREFARYDLNHDGIITAAECLKVEKAKAGSK